MMRKNLWVATGLLALLGCTDEANVPSKDNTKPVSPAPANPGETPATPATAPADEKKAAADVKLKDDEIAAIDKLPEEDRAAALAQKVCAVNGENNLGSMGVPVKVTADGKSAFLCCKGCKDEFDADPKAVFAKLGK